ncbi:MAG TPA: protein-glutamate O-methyltransferase CheR [Longimicrobiales bacterium]
MNRSLSRGNLTEALGVSATAFALLRDLIEQRLGIHYDDAKYEMLADKLSQVVVANDMQSFLDYYYALKYDTDADRYWNDLADHLSVPETYFWRQPEQFEALVKHVIPKHGHRPLRIWSAACCTGEEPISIAMAIAEAGLKHKPVEIIASDASAVMVERARRGVYGGRAFRNLNPELRDRYFVPENGGWRVSQELHDSIDWRVINLVSDRDVATVPPVDVVFCRNVFIYFSDATIKQVARSFANILPVNGLLFLGASESLTRLETDFMLEEIGNAFVYVNQKNAADSAAYLPHGARFKE